MIDRRALWICLFLVLAMTAAAFWRLSSLADWHHVPIGLPGEHHTVNGFMLFVEPASLLLVMMMPYFRKWLNTGPEQALQPWQRWSSRMLLLFAPVLALMQALVLARSFGMFSDSDVQPLAKAFMVLAGLLLVVVGNAVPKLPWLSSRVRPFRLDPWQWNRQLRFVGRLMVAFGLLVAIVCPWLPPQTLRLVFIPAWLALMAASTWHRIRLKREPSPQ
jgi:hypothetical protein